MEKHEGYSDRSGNLLYGEMVRQMMDKQYKVSVIIPVYNAAEFLREGLDSLLRQTLREIEVICVDDGSKDASWDILQEYAGRDGRIMPVRQENQGAGAARNNGLALAHGEYLAFLDADDFYEPDMLKKAYLRAKACDADVCVYNADLYDHTKKEFKPCTWAFRKQFFPGYEPFSAMDEKASGRIFQMFNGWPWDKLYRRAFVLAEDLRYQNLRTTNDMFFVFIALAKAKKTVTVDEILVHQRVNVSTSLSRNRDKSWDCFYIALRAMQDRLKNDGIYGKLEQSFVNWAVNFSLWQIRTMTGAAFEQAYELMRTEGFEQLDATRHDRSYFYSGAEYSQFLHIYTTPLEKYRTEKADKEAEKNAPVNVSQPVKQEKPAKQKPAKSTEKKSAGFFAGIRRRLSDHLPAGRKYMNTRFEELLKEQAEQQAKQLDILKKMRQREDLMVRRLEESSKAVTNLRTFVGTELARRDDWQNREAQITREANGRKVWIIKCPAPEGPEKIRWGDYPFALALKKNLEKLGIYTVVDLHEDWGCPETADVVLVLRGSHFFRPDRRNSRCVYIMWNISHPDWVTDEEYNLYDIVCVGSIRYANILRERLTVPVYPLLQCTDTEMFYPKETSGEKQYDYIFIGNARGVARSCVMWAVREHLPLTMWGSGWEEILRNHQDLFQGKFIDNSLIPDIYRSARICLNDHWGDMAQKQFVNNRIFDALACGLPVISDSFDELRELFPDAVLHYTNEQEFKECIRRVNEDYDGIQKRAAEQWPLIQREYSFEARARQLVELAEKC